MIKELTWLSTDRFLPNDGETVLLAWTRDSGITYRTGRLVNGKWRLSAHDKQPHQAPMYYAELKESK